MKTRKENEKDGKSGGEREENGGEEEGKGEEGIRRSEGRGGGSRGGPGTDNGARPRRRLSPGGDRDRDR